MNHQPTIHPLIKVIAMTVFILLPFIGFYVGIQYQQSLSTTNHLSPTIQPIVSPQPLVVHRDNKRYKTAEELLAAVLGESYFKSHYTFIEQTDSSQSTVRVDYRFSYPPLVDDQRFAIFFDLTTGTLSTSEVSVSLYQPQELVVDANRAEQIAQEQGLEGGSSLTAELRFDIVIMRFVWVVTSVDVPKISRNQGKIYGLVLDAETGQVVRIKKVEPIRSQ